MDSLRILDNNYIEQDIEKAFLCNIFGSPEKLVEYIQIDQNIFGLGIHRAIWIALVGCWRAVGSIDHALIKSEIKKTDELVDGYYWEIAMGDLNWKSLEMYHDRLIELWKKREINKILQKTHVLLSESSDAAVSHINEKIRGIGVDKKTSFDFMDIVKDVLDSECVNDEIVMVTGYKKLDGKIQGFRQGQLVIVSGRPGMGKTMFATNLLFRNIANGYKAVFFSLEMTPTQITQRLLTKGSKVPLSNIMSKSYTHAQEDALGRAYTKFLELEPNVKIETKAFSISDIILKIRYYNFVDGVKIFYIDQLQRISAKGENRIFEIEKITNELKKIAMDLGIVIILMCQLNREAANKEPQLINLKNSGAIEQDADIVLFPHRDNYGEGEMKTDKIRVIIAKNRNGGESEVELGLDQSIMHIYDI